MSAGANAAGPAPACPDRRESDPAAYLRFLAAGRRFWAEPLFQALFRQIEDARAADQRLTDDDEFERFVVRHPTHQFFAWFERHLQRMKYSGRWGLAASSDARRAALVTELEQSLPDGLLHLDSAFEPPAYYGDHDIHQQPGGLGSDPIAGFVYRDATASSGVVDRPQLHDRFALLATRDRRADRIVDLGCGFGRSTLAFAAVAPNAQVYGIDVSMGCLRLAAHGTPDVLRSRVSYRQADAVATGLPAGSFDIVTSTMLLHEMPVEAILRLIAETARLVAPRGIAVHLDFLAPSHPLLRTLFAGHARRNNEPFLLDPGRADLPGAYARAGFRSVQIQDFEEEDGALGAPGRKWRLPWKVIVAQR